MIYIGQTDRSSPDGAVFTMRTFLTSLALFVLVPDFLQDLVRDDGVLLERLQYWIEFE